MPRPLRAAPLVASLATLPALAALAQPPAGAPRPLTHADYARWETLGAGALSPDGKWAAWEVRRGTVSELHYRPVAADSERTVALASGALFSSDGRWLLYTVSPDTSGGAGRARAPGATPARNRVGIVDLTTGATTTVDEVQSFALAKAGPYVALRRYAAPGRPGSRGADVVVRDLAHGTDLAFGNVAELAWSDAAPLLAMTLDVAGKTGNGVQLLNAATGALRALDAGDLQYAGLQWRERATDLAVLRSRVDSAFADTGYTVLAWRALDGAPAATRTYDFAADGAFPTRLRVASYRRPRWADDGSTLFVGVAPREPKAPAQRGTAAQPARVEVWHWKDVRQYHQQDRQAEQDRQRTWLAAWHLAPGKLVVLADSALENVQLSDNGKLAIAVDDAPYRREAATGRPSRDVYRIDLATGARTQVATRVASFPRPSPDGRYVLYAQGGHWWAYDVATGARANLTGKIARSFVNQEDDHPTPERQPYGAAGWTTGERSVLLYDRYDVWQVSPDGARATRLTRGAEDSTVYRYTPLDPDERLIDLARPVYLAATGDWSKKSGFARLVPGRGAERLVWREKALGRLAKARRADVFLFDEQSYEDSPDFHVATSASLADARQLSRTNAFQRDFAWGKQELLPYVNGRGDTLQMMLTYPAGYQPGKRYPMVVYYYEKLSQGFHQYVVPTDRATYNTTVFSQEGYFVLRPDIRFRPRDPGWSGLDCVTAAVQAVLATGMVDPARVGNMGHSWGGYQSAFYAVHGKGLFAATIAGAPLTNLVSFYGYTSFNTGSPETGHFETGQERMEVSLWEDPQAYIRNSTVFAMDSLRTPLLLEEGDADGNVDYRQSMELYNAGKRLGKQVAFLLYNDENHGVARPESQRDYHTRQLEWFAHYLKGEPAAAWIADGETYLARQKLLKGATEAPAAPSPATPTRAAAGGGRPQE